MKQIAFVIFIKSCQWWDLFLYFLLSNPDVFILLIAWTRTSKYNVELKWWEYISLPSVHIRGKTFSNWQGWPPKWLSVSCSVVSNSLWSHGLYPTGSFVHGILQARNLELVAIPFSRVSSQSREWTQVSHIAGRFFTVWGTREAPT